MRRLLLLLVSSLLLAVAAPAAPAWAHTSLVSSSPSPDVPAESPSEVVLFFSDAVQPGLSAVSVTGADGRELVAGTPAAGGERSTVTQALRSPLAPGTYRVAYRVLAADGHPVTGSFEVTAVAPAPAPTAGATAAASPSPVSTSEPETESETAPAADVDGADGGDTGGGDGMPLLPLALGGLAVAGITGLLARRLGGSASA